MLHHSHVRRTRHRAPRPHPRWPLLSTLALLVGLVAPAWGELPRTLKYLGRYESQPGPDKMQGLAIIDADYLAVVSPTGFAVVDRAELDTGTVLTPVGRYDIAAGQDSNLDGAPPGDTHYDPKFFRVVVDMPYAYVATRFDGLWVMHLEAGESWAIEEESRLLTPREFTENLHLVDGRLFVTHHADGLEVLDVAADPVAPPTLARLREPLVDAWGVWAEADGTVWVADGAGGLKLLQYVEGQLLYVAGEDPATSPGTVFDVTVTGGWVLAATGGRGLTVYDHATGARHAEVDLPGVCVDITAMPGGMAALACRSWVHVVQVSAAGEVTRIASTPLHRRVKGIEVSNDKLTTHIGHQVAFQGGRLYVAAWHHLDAFLLTKDDPEDDPAIWLSGQRAQIGVDASPLHVSIENGGEGLLEITGVTCPPGIVCTLDQPILGRGETASLEIAWDGTTPSIVGEAEVSSNDPDEGLLWINVFSPKPDDRVDPGEPAPDFTGTAVRRDYATGTFVERQLTLSEISASGTTAYFVVFGSWCPACVPAVASMVGDLAAHLPDNAVIFLVNPEGIPELIRHVLEKIHLPVDVFLDLDGTVNGAYGQPRVGLPFGRSYVVDASGIATAVFTSYEPDPILAAIEAASQ